MYLECKVCKESFYTNNKRNLGFCNSCKKNLQEYVCVECGKTFKSTPKTVYIKKIKVCKECTIKKVNMLKYGTIHPMKCKYVAEKCATNRMKNFDNESFRKKFRATKIKHYGSLEKYNEVVNQKRANTNIKKYGTAFPQKLQETKQRQAQTCMKRYGTTSVGQNSNVKEKIKQTCLEKYGVENPFQSKKIQEKIKQTCLEKYGVENPRSCQQVQEKYKQIWLQKTPEEKRQIREKSTKTYWCYRNKLSLEEKKKLRSRSCKKYIYENIEQFDSSWELAVWLWVQDNGLNIVREPIVLEYEYAGQKHTYYPDFQIGTKLVEIKGPQFFKSDGTMCNPFDHSLDPLFEAKHQCGLKHGVEFWSSKEMKPILKHVEKKYGKNWKKHFLIN